MTSHTHGTHLLPSESFLDGDLVGWVVGTELMRLDRS